MKIKIWHETVEVVSITPVNHIEFKRNDLEYTMESTLKYHVIYKTETGKSLDEEVYHDIRDINIIQEL